MVLPLTITLITSYENTEIWINENTNFYQINPRRAGTMSLWSFTSSQIYTTSFSLSIPLLILSYTAVLERNSGNTWRRCAIFNNNQIKKNTKGESLQRSGYPSRSLSCCPGFDSPLKTLQKNFSCQSSEASQNNVKYGPWFEKMLFFLFFEFSIWNRTWLL